MLKHPSFALDVYINMGCMLWQAASAPTYNLEREKVPTNDQGRAQVSLALIALLYLTHHIFGKAALLGQGLALG
jgi:hypothetical protein